MQQFVDTFDRFSKLSCIRQPSEQFVEQTSKEEDSFDIDD
jgi:hypothetical protein